MVMLGVSLSSAAGPSGDFFEIHANPFTGADDSGDGGTGNPADLNYYYVGQAFDGAVAINASGTTAANIWIDYDQALIQANNLTPGTYFNTWAGHSIQSGRIKSTGYNFPPSQSSALGEFGGIQLTMLKPSAVNYGTGSPAVLDINTGQIGATTESNISINGADILDSAEDFQIHIWADTKKPYAKNPQPANHATGILTDSLFSFDLRDSLHGEGDDTGVGTGANMNTAEGDITFDDGSGTVSLKGLAAYTCSGIWGSNLCDITVNAPVVTTFSGDTRKWKYGTEYTVEISGYEDLASSNQNQLGDANGPNVMNSAIFTFTTESDITSPQISNVSPVTGSADHPLNSLISFEITDRKSYPSGMSGSGVLSNTCRVTVSSPSFGSHEFAEGEGVDEVTVTQVDYGYRFVIDPVDDFSSNETVTVRIHDCADDASNAITEEVYTFSTIILDADGDDILDAFDNCPNTPNFDQLNSDGDEFGDVCDDCVDPDEDEICGEQDNCPLIPNADQADIDEDEIGDACDDDRDDDEILNDDDNCPDDPNFDQVNTDGEPDGGDACDDDDDNDGVEDDFPDNCRLTPNADQADADGDGEGNVCDEDYIEPDADTDEDGIFDIEDNCRFIPNPDQLDSDVDELGDVCDNCPFIINPDQADIGYNGIGDVCDAVFVIDGVEYLIDTLQEDLPEESAPCTSNCFTVNLFSDKNGNGIQEEGEDDTWFADITASVYTDVNGNGIYEEGQDTLYRQDARSIDPPVPAGNYFVVIGNLPKFYAVLGGSVGFVIIPDYNAPVKVNVPIIPNVLDFANYILLAVMETDSFTAGDFVIISFNDPESTQRLPIEFDETGRYEEELDMITELGIFGLFVKGRLHLSQHFLTLTVLKDHLEVRLGEAYEFDEVLQVGFGRERTFTNGDLTDDDLINAFDLVSLIRVYNAITEQPADLNHDNFVNAFDLVSLIRNYNDEGDTSFFEQFQ